jgi:glycopeptide antibiotics resistance protein
MHATQPNPTRAATTFLLAAYLLTLGALVFLPFGRGMDLGDRINLDPFFTIDRALDLGPRSASFRLLIGNIVAFVPLGLLLPLVVRSRARFLVTFGAALALSAGIEAGQFAVSSWLGYAYRSTDVDDVILNVTGALVGYAGFAVVNAFSTERVRR